MTFYRHRFDRVEQYLHHRAPYLMVDRIVTLDEQQLTTEKTVRESDFFIAGHFPGAPIMPGAMMQEMTTQSAGILLAANYNPQPTFNTEDPFFNEYALGVLTKVRQAQYRGFARPGDCLLASVRLEQHVDRLFEFSAQIRLNSRIIMRIEFQLANIKSQVLQGRAGLATAED